VPAEGRPWAVGGLDIDESISYVADVLRIIDRGDARGGSFAFRALDDTWSLADGVPLREVRDMTIREVFLGVTFERIAERRSRSACAQRPRPDRLSSRRAELKQLLRAR
jgi:phage head maturation protease